MNKILAYIFCGFAMVYLSACQQKMICPAYHSYFILDVDETKNTFSLFGPDSLPKKTWEVDKEKYGIAKEIPREKKLKEMRIISMNSVYKKLEDPFANFQREFAESDSVIYIDSAAVMAQSQTDRDFQNIDQMIYLHHFGKYLPKKGEDRDLLKEDLKEEEPLIADDEADQLPPEKKKKFWPFGNKKQKTNDNPEEEELEEEEE
ncbi:MAG: hypothetical protein HC819_08125 [Cyclobacteriaceae bacterium]|nr:hypothetical protein [Cyclobacteriaceae bacterium]